MQFKKIMHGTCLSKHAALTYKRLLAGALVLACILPLFACSSRQANSLAKNFDNYGAEIAKKIADIGSRPGGSANEKAAADLIAAEFTKLGYRPETQAVSKNGVNSQNIIVKIPGFGMNYNNSELSKARFLALGNHLGNSQRTAIVIARYNTVNREGITQADGTVDNAAGVAALLTLAKQLKNVQVGYDLILAAVGAGDVNYAGSETLLNSLSETDRKRVDCVYEIRNIYGGSKLYAHSGWNSLSKKEDKYMRRLAVYQLVDVALEEGLGTNSPFDSIFTNQAGFSIPSPLNNNEQVIYREFTLNESDYRTFDAAGINTVYIESWNYDAADAAEIKQSDNLQFAEGNGLIAGSNYDNFAALAQVFTANQLERRINSVAFILLKGLIKGELGSQVRTSNY